MNIAVLHGTLISRTWTGVSAKTTLQGLYQGIGQLLIVITCIFSTFQPLMNMVDVNLLLPLTPPLNAQ